MGRGELDRYRVLCAVLALVTGACNLDPVHRASVNALGPEQPDFYPPDSEYHRPGEPCVLCHAKTGPAKSTFVLAGTVFWGPDNYDRRVDAAYVRIIDAGKTKKCFVTNCNGNFFVRPEEFDITFPVLVSVERVKEPFKDESTLLLRRMNGHIGREPSCAMCHIQGLRDFASPGQIAMYYDENQAKAAPPSPPCPPPPEQPVVRFCPEDRP